MAPYDSKGETFVSTNSSDPEMSKSHEAGHLDSPNGSFGSFARPQSFDPAREAKLVRKIDLRLLLMLFVIYVAAFLDRVNISNALTMGLQKDLHLKGNQANIALSIFFVPYVVFEIPFNILMKKLTPHVWLSGCTVIFGIIMLGQGFVKSFSGLIATRFFLGFAEAGIFPGCFYLISFWYKREESQKRFTFFWCSVLIASGFGGLLASAIAKMDGIRGLENWRWIFILEGLGTICIGILAFFLVTDFPEQARWLTEEEKDMVRERTGMHKSQPQPITSKDVLWFFRDFKRILGGIMYFGVVTSVYSYSFFAPTIIKTLGYSVVQTQLHSVIPVAAALALCALMAIFSDLARVRSPFAAFSISLLITGLGVLMNIHHHFSVQFGAICLVAMGAFSAGIIIVCWYVMNLHGHVERSIGTAWMISFGNIGGIIATFTFLATDAPYYKKGYAICMGTTCLAAASCIAYAALTWRENRRLAARGVQSLKTYSL